MIAQGISPALKSDLTEIQHLLFNLGGELCLPKRQFILQMHVDWLEQELDRLNADLPMLREFVLPGGSPAAAICQVARTVCRRAERQMVTLAREQLVHPEALAFINRLSDFLFVVARVLAREGSGEVLWHHPGRPDR